MLDKTFRGGTDLANMCVLMISSEPKTNRTGQIFLNGLCLETRSLHSFPQCPGSEVQDV